MKQLEIKSTMTQSKIKSIFVIPLKDSQEYHFRKYKTAKELKDLDNECNNLNDFLEKYQIEIEQLKEKIGKTHKD